MKKEHYWLLGGVIGGLLIGYFYAKNQYEPTSSAAGHYNRLRRQNRKNWLKGQEQ